MELQDRVAEPVAVTLDGVIAPQARPEGTVSVNVTVPAKPFKYVIVIVEVADVFRTTAAGELAETVKS